MCAGDMIAQILPKSGISEVQIKGEVSSGSSSSISVPSTSTLKSSQSESRGESRVKNESFTNASQ